MEASCFSHYDDLDKAAASVREGRHRIFIGGMWDELGKLQFDFLRSRGLEPDMRLIDIGCGCLRAGVHLISYLDAGHYFGTDISQDLLDAGYDRELAPLGLTGKLPRENLRADGEFDIAQFGVRFDFALAQSVFTHLPFNHLKLCLARAASAIAPGGKLCASLFLVPEGEDWSRPLMHARGGITSWPDRNPFHFAEADVRHCALGLPWEIEEIVDWNHPRDATMVVFRREDEG